MTNSATVIGFGLPIGTVEPEEEKWLLLYCPEQGGWHTGVYHEGQWRDSATLSVVLEPTHYLLLPPDPFDAG